VLTENARRFADPATGKLDFESVLDGLLIDGLVEESAVQLMRSISRGPSSGKSLGPLERIAASGWKSARDPDVPVDLDFLSRWLADKVELPWRRIDPLNIDVTAVTAVMSSAYATRFNVICVEADVDHVVIGTTEPFDDEWQRELAGVLQKEVRLVICNPDDIRRYLGELYQMSKSVLSAKKEHSGQSSAVQNLEQLMQLGRGGKLEANDSHVVSIVDWLLQYAYEQRASDIHIEPRRETGAVRFRIDGVDQGKEVELRISTMPTAFGEKMVMRIFNPEVLVKDQTALGFDKQEADVWNDMIRQPNGIVLVTGPTGSGKTTTLYSSLQMLATPEVNVCTIEDPIELVVPAFNQMQVQHNIDLDFAAGVRTLLRQDPDIIMVGEIRDIETAQMAVQAALTGHLVLATLHTNDAASAPVGCLECRQTGFLGRAGIYELLKMSPGTKEMVMPDTNLEDLRKQAFSDGMRPLRVSGLSETRLVRRCPQKYC